MVEIDPNEQEYSVRFKPKDKRQNFRDDKLEILRQVIGLSDTNNVLDLIKEARRTANSDYKINPNIAKDPQTIVDINKYEIPSIHIKLTPEQAAALRRHVDIMWVKATQMRYPTAETIPWGVSRVGADQLDPSTRHRGYAVKVAVLDTGMDDTHPDIKPNFKGGANFVGTTTLQPEDAPTYHGQHVSGTVAAAINNVDVVGVAPEAFLYIGKIFGPTGGATTAAITQALLWADENNMEVVNMSIGLPDGMANPDPDEADAVHVNYIHNRFVSCAAGNSGRLDFESPAGYPGAWAVGATDETDSIATFSSWGDKGYVDFTAPGVNIISDNKGSGTHSLQGTSMATPHISGIAAIAYANYRFTPCDTNTYPPAQPKIVHIAGAMIAACDTLGQTSPGVASIKFGFGMPQVPQMVAILTGQA